MPHEFVAQDGDSNRPKRAIVSQLFGPRYRSPSSNHEFGREPYFRFGRQVAINQLQEQFGSPFTDWFCCVWCQPSSVGDHTCGNDHLRGRKRSCGRPRKWTWQSTYCLSSRYFCEGAGTPQADSIRDHLLTGGYGPVPRIKLKQRTEGAEVSNTMITAETLWFAALTTSSFAKSRARLAILEQKRKMRFLSSLF